MIGLILCLVYIGRAFSELAHEFYKNRWLFAILGIVVFYAGQLLAGLIFGAVCLLVDYDISQINEFVLNLIGLFFGGVICWGFYRILKNRWANESLRSEKAMNEAEIIDDQLID